MYKKILINGIISLQTGLHIGGDSTYSPIGLTDNYVVKDKLTKLPIIPGSSLKGKMRVLLSKAKKGKYVNHDDDPEDVLKLFGSSKKNNIYKTRLIFSDCMMRNENSDVAIDVTEPYEIKFENTINRVNITANPRQMERVVRGTKFNMNITYNVEEESEIESDILNIIQGLKLLQTDYLGGGGSRGNGRILFENFEISALDENLQIVKDEKLSKQFDEVCEYGKLCYKI